MSDIAIIGTGISGLGAAAILHPRHQVTLYEKSDYVGGHTRTRSVDYGDRKLDVDTGFIVFNYRNYPNLAALFDYLGVSVQKSTMSFAVMAPADNLEWGAQTIGSLFGQRDNLFRKEFYKFLFDIVKFNFRARAVVKHNSTMTMDELIAELNLGDWFRRFYILPMGGAIWSLPLAAIMDFPAKKFVDFFHAHGLLTVTRQPQWYSVVGGSAEYVRLLTRPFKKRIRLSTGVVSVSREKGKVQITDTKGEKHVYDQVIFACHADEALSMLAEPSAAETETLGAFRYQKNMAVLHRDVSVMPRHRACWASWVYHAGDTASPQPIAVTYWMNQLQNLNKFYPVFVTLNPPSPIDEKQIFERHEFMHPIYDQAAVAAQYRLDALQGQRNTWFCGAYHGNGFHEDGLVSAIEMAARMGVSPPWN